MCVVSPRLFAKYEHQRPTQCCVSPGRSSLQNQQQRLPLGSDLSLDTFNAAQTEVMNVVLKTHFPRFVEMVSSQGLSALRSRTGDVSVWTT